MKSKDSKYFLVFVLALSSQISIAANFANENSFEDEISDVRAQSVAQPSPSLLTYHASESGRINASINKNCDYSWKRISSFTKPVSAVFGPDLRSVQIQARIFVPETTSSVSGHYGVGYIQGIQGYNAPITNPCYKNGDPNLQSDYQNVGNRGIAALLTDEGLKIEVWGGGQPGVATSYSSGVDIFPGKITSGYYWLRLTIEPFSSYFGKMLTVTADLFDTSSKQYSMQNTFFAGNVLYDNYDLTGVVFQALSGSYINYDAFDWIGN